MTGEDVRIERDRLGEKSVPAFAYWGVHTERARENFLLARYPVNPRLVRALAAVKKACCLANAALGYLDGRTADAIAAACDEVRDGRLAGQFPLDALQGGAGTSTNMNLNEVVANRAVELLGGERGRYDMVHPIEHVNLHQSTNDVYPTALKIAVIQGVRELAAAVARLQGAFQRKEREFAGIVKLGRTELQDAVPMTLGAEFSAFAEAFARDRWRAFKCEERLRVVNIGGTAVGTGLCAPRRYIFLVIEKLRETTGLGLSRGENAVDQTANADSFVEVSGIMKALAVDLVKVSGDLRLMNLLGEVRLPAVQTGSSIMPGKVNPVIAEAVMQAGMKAAANDALVTDAVSRGSLQISEFLPLVAFALLESIDILMNASALLATHVDGIRADGDRCAALLDRSPGVITAFVPHIGYVRAEELLREFAASGQDDIRRFLGGKLGAETVSRVLDPYRLSALGYQDEANP